MARYRLNCLNWIYILRMEKVELLSIAKDIAKKQLQKQCEDIDLDPLMPIGMGI